MSPDEPTAHFESPQIAPPPQGENTPPKHPLRSTVEGYAPGEGVPLFGYAGLMAIFGGALAALLVSRHRRTAPEKMGISDIALLGTATHRTTRVISRDWVTAPIRAPFTQYEESAGGGEVEESARGAGLRKATGQLLTCRFCVGPWVALAWVAGFLFSPRLTRITASIFSISAFSDALHHGYDKLQS